MKRRTEPRLLLLCEVEDRDRLVAALTRAGATADAVTVAYDRSELESAMAGTADARAGGTAVRLIAFHTNVVVPAAMLAALPGPSYNFHPGSPDYPGLHPAAFALYDQAPRFGATAHEMRPRVDSGPIVAACFFPTPPDADLPLLAAKARHAAHALFERLAPALADAPTPLPPVDMAWGPRRCSQAALAAMLRAPPDAGPAEISRRVRAFGLLGFSAAGFSAG